VNYEQWPDTRGLRIHFRNLLDLARVGRKIEYGIVVGVITSEMASLQAALQATGIEVEMFKRGAESGKEQGVDQYLQVHMLRVLVDYPPGVAVLLTGDGRGCEDGAGFHPDLGRMYKKGWGIEVMSWDIACNQRLHEWAQAVGTCVRLEDCYASIPFMEGITSYQAARQTRQGRYEFQIGEAMK